MNMRARKWIKRLTFTMAIIPLIIVLGFVGAMQFVDFNRYKPELEKQISTKTGFGCELKGDVNLKLYPFGLELNQLSLLSDERFQHKPLLEIAKMEVSISLWSLFMEQKLKVRGIELQQPILYLSVSATGQKNWQPAPQIVQARPIPSYYHAATYQTVSQPLSQGVASVSPVASPITAHHGVMSWSLNHFVIEGGGVVYHNAQTKETLKVSDFSVLALNVKPNQSFSTTLSFMFENINQHHRVETQFSTDILLNPTLTEIRLSDVKGFSTLNLPEEMNIPNARLNLQGKRILINRDQETVSIKGVSLDFLNAQLATDFEGGYGKAYHFKGHVQVARLNLPQIMRNLNQKGIQFVNKLALNDVNLDTQFSVTPQSLALNQLDLAFDKTHITGDFWQKGTEQPAYRFKLAIDQIDLDAYQVIAQKVKKDKVEKGQVKKGQVKKGQDLETAPSLTNTYLPLAIPVRTLRHLDAQGALTIGKLQIWQQHYQNLTTTLSAKLGKLNFAPLDARLYQGRLQSKLTLDVRYDTPQYHWKGKVDNVDLQPFLTDGWQNNQLKGLYKGYFDFKTRGVNETLLKQNMNGRFSANITQGAVKGVDLNLLLAGKPSKKTDFTQFESLDLNGDIQDGTYHINHFSFMSNRFKGQGFGKVYLVPAKIKAKINVQILKSPPQLPDLQGLELPITLTGPLKQLKWSVAIKDLISTPQNQTRLINTINRLLQDKG